MLINYYANKKKFPNVALVATKLNTLIHSGSIIKPCTLKLFQIPVLARGLLTPPYDITTVVKSYG